VDRRKKNMMYLETLKTYSKEAIQFGCHSLFFPGGTRSRSGIIESKLKLGLLSTAIEAQRANFQNGITDVSGKIFIVPVTIQLPLCARSTRTHSRLLEHDGSGALLQGK